MAEPRRAEDAVLEIFLDRLWQDGPRMQVLLSVWAAGYAEGQVDGYHEARFPALMAEEEK